jgi:hypothetical protein
LQRVGAERGGGGWQLVLNSNLPSITGSLIVREFYGRLLCGILVLREDVFDVLVVFSEKCCFRRHDEQL